MNNHPIAGLIRRIRTGFTIIELLVVVGVLGIMAGIVLVAVNPGEQSRKARDTQRKNDFSQMKLALENYYTDFNSYPPSTGTTGGEPHFRIQSGTWGNPWQPYMAKVPKDPLASKNYAYISDGQSYQLYAYLERGDKDPDSCPGGCGPNGEYFYGATSSNARIGIIQVPPTPTPTPAGPTPTLPPGAPTPTFSPPPSPTPPPLPSGPMNFTVSQANANPRFIEGLIDPLNANPGQTQQFRVVVRDTTRPVLAVLVTVKTDNQQRQYPLFLSEGTDTDGTWSGSWTMDDTHEVIYQFIMNASDGTDSSNVTISIR